MSDPPKPSSLPSQRKSLRRSRRRNTSRSSGPPVSDDVRIPARRKSSRRQEVEYEYAIRMDPPSNVVLTSEYFQVRPCELFDGWESLPTSFRYLYHTIETVDHGPSQHYSKLSGDFEKHVEILIVSSSGLAEKAEDVASVSDSVGSENVCIVTPSRLVLFFLDDSEIGGFVDRLVECLNSHCRLRLRKDRIALKKARLQRVLARKEREAGQESLRRLEAGAPELFVGVPAVENAALVRPSPKRLSLMHPGRDFRVGSDDMAAIMAQSSEAERFSVFRFSVQLEENLSFDHTDLEGMRNSLIQAKRQFDILLGDSGESEGSQDDTSESDPPCAQQTREKVRDLTQNTIQPMVDGLRNLDAFHKTILKTSIQASELKEEMRGLQAYETEYEKE